MILENYSFKELTLTKKRLLISKNLLSIYEALQRDKNLINKLSEKVQKELIFYIKYIEKI